MVQTINNHQSQPSLQQTALDKHQSTTANHKLGKPDTLSQYASMKPDKPSIHSKIHCKKGNVRAQNGGIAGGVRRS